MDSACVDVGMAGVKGMCGVYGFACLLWCVMRVRLGLCVVCVGLCGMWGMRVC